MLVRAYVLFEVDTDAEDVLQRLKHHSLGNCKVLASQLHPEEIIACLEADGFERRETLEHFNAALTELVGEAGVRRATTLRIATTP